uniref:EGF-like domain-containing protein n=1 Tax=Ditylenchus dipsaci TaxID=166011 RepID=A0A915E7I1_9BILA
MGTSGFCDNGYCVCKATYVQVENFCLPPAKPIIDDPSSYIDPDISGNGAGTQSGSQEYGSGNHVGNTGGEEEHSAFGMKFGRLGSTNGQNNNGWMNTGAGGGKDFPHFLPWKFLFPLECQFQPPDRWTSALLTILSKTPLHPMQGYENTNSINSPVPNQNSWLSNLPTNYLEALQQQIYQQQQNQFTGYNLNLNSGDYSSFPSNVQHFPTHPFAQGAQTLKLETKKGGKSPIENEDEDLLPSGPGETPKSVAMPGEHCGSGNVCLGNSRCSKAGWCQCPEGMRIEKGGICAYQTGKGTVPLNAAHKPPHITMFGSGDQIVLQNSGNQEQHLAVRQPYDSCSNSERCIEGADCIRSSSMPAVQRLGPFCQCKPERVYFLQSCILRRANIEVVKVGRQCTPAHICDSGAVCAKDGICRCAEGKRLIVGMCVTQALPGESCANGEFCIDSAVCAAGIDACVCPVGMKVRQGKCEEEGKKSVKTSLERKKSVVLPPAIAAAPAIEQEKDQVVLNKKKSTKESKSELKSGVSALPGQICDEDTVCSSDSVCSAGGYCQCKDGFTEVYNRCVPLDQVRKPGDLCLPHLHFCSSSSWCKDGRCRCLNRSPPHNGQCTNNPNRRRKPNHNPFQAAHSPPKLFSNNPQDSTVIDHHHQLFQNPQKLTCDTSKDCPRGSICGTPLVIATEWPSLPKIQPKAFRSQIPTVTLIKTVALV